MILGPGLYAFRQRRLGSMLAETSTAEFSVMWLSDDHLVDVLVRTVGVALAMESDTAFPCEAAAAEFANALDPLRAGDRQVHALASVRRSGVARRGRNFTSCVMPR